MFIQTDSENNIIQLISIGCKPEINGYEISDDTPVEILQNIFDYKYINDEFILKEDSNNEKIENLKNKKISVLSSVCNKIIIGGISFNNEHYSLTEHDQINLSKLETLAKDNNKVLYHADGKKCRIYEPEEFLALTELAFAFINYNITYFNLLKSQINECVNVEEILPIHYGTQLSEENQQILDLTGASLIFSIPEIQDDTNYDIIFNSVNNIEELIEEAKNFKISQEKEENEEIIEENEEIVEENEEIIEESIEKNIKEETV